MPLHSDSLLTRAAQLAQIFVNSLANRPVRNLASTAELRLRLGGALPLTGRDPLTVLEEFVVAADPGIVASAGPRYFGHVISGGLPIALATDWMTSSWDQNAVLHACSPANSVVEEIVAEWLIDLFGLRSAGRAISVGFTSGCQMAHVTALLAARHAVLRSTGWNVESDGLLGAPEIHVFVSAEAHGSILTALQYIGLGRDRAIRIETDGQGRMKPESLCTSIRQADGPKIICAQAGSVNGGAFDPFEEIAAISREVGAWFHVDGAFGLWAAASSLHCELLKGAELADSWATDAHKWLNVPHDSGIVLVADPVSHLAAMSVPGETYLQTNDRDRDPYRFVPELSRRARAFVVYTTLRTLGRQGVADLVETSCRLTRLFAKLLSTDPYISVVNEIHLNQALLRISPGEGASDTMTDAFTQAVIEAVQADDTCWLGGATWQGRRVMRLSLCNFRTYERDIERSAGVILRIVRQLRAEHRWRSMDVDPCGA